MYIDGRIATPHVELSIHVHVHVNKSALHLKLPFSAKTHKFHKLINDSGVWVCVCMFVCLCGQFQDPSVPPALPPRPGPGHLLYKYTVSSPTRQLHSSLPSSLLFSSLLKTSS